MEIEYIVLHSNHIEELKQLNRLFGDVFEDEKTYHQSPPSDQYLKSLFKKNLIFIVAKLKKEIVGGLAAYQLEKFEQERREVYIYDLAVKENFRRKKIATQLIKTLQGVAAQLGAYVIFVQADKGDIPAISLYESLGIGEDIHHFDIVVGDSSVKNIKVEKNK